MTVATSPTDSTGAVIYLSPRPITIALSAERADPDRSTPGVIHMGTRIKYEYMPAQWALAGVVEVTPNTFADLHLVQWEDEKVLLAAAAIELADGGLDLVVAVYAPSFLPSERMASFL